MFTLLAVLVYAAAIAIPAFLLHRFHSLSWYWHVLAILAGLSLGLLPMPPEFQKRGADLVFGFFFVALMAWGVGGLFVAHPHRPHSARHA
jgi:hypothetical protein